MLRIGSINDWVLIVMDQFTRRIVGLGVHAGDVDGVALCRMFNKAISTMDTPKYFSSDNDPLFQYHQWQANLSILDVDEVKSVPYTPRSHLFVERLIGTIRREFLDHTLFWNAVDLERKLSLFKEYYNHSRTHASLACISHSLNHIFEILCDLCVLCGEKFGLDGNTPAEMSADSVGQPAPLNSYAWEKHRGGLFLLPIAA